jgi:hypothetical protein
VTPPAHRATTANLVAAYPFVAGGSLGKSGVVVGRDLLGGTFCYDPFQLYQEGFLTNPNMVVFGQIGRGKSSFVKSYLFRQIVFGARCWIIDPKGEYSALARACGSAPVKLYPGGRLRLNPLDPGSCTPDLGSGTPDTGSGGNGVDPRGNRQIALLTSLASTCLDRQLLPGERTALELALADATARCGGMPVLPSVVEALLSPSAASAETVHISRGDLAQEGRDAALELRRLVHGDLRGMFDAETTPGLSLNEQMVVLDLSAVYGSDALAAIMVCALAWLQSYMTQAALGKLFIVIDEAWAIMANLSVARWLQASWKLARAHGVANMAIFHRVSDLRSVDDEGSWRVGLAQGLLADSETRVIYGQPPGEAGVAQQELSLSDTEVHLLERMARGTAIWKVAQRSFLVRHVLSAAEMHIVDTDAHMAGHRRAGDNRAGSAGPDGLTDGALAGPDGLTDGARLHGPGAVELEPARLPYVRGRDIG